MFSSSSLAADLSLTTEVDFHNNLDDGVQRKLSCRQISDILCGTEIFDSFCELLSEAGLESVLAKTDSKWTVFAPTNGALEDIAFDEFDSLSYPSNITENGNETNELNNLLLYHLIPDRILNGASLGCGDVYTMGNGEDSMTVCNGGMVYQSGAENEKEYLPLVVITDVAACNGVIHVVNGVMLPPLNGIRSKQTPAILSISEPDRKPQENEEPPVEGCKSIQEVVCGQDMLSVACSMFHDENVWVSETTSDLWTVFAPTNQGFEAVKDIIDSMEATALLDVLKYHIVPGEELYLDDLVCESSVMMGNGQASFTSCSIFSGYIYQEGPGNMVPREPRIVATDIPSCNGLVHVVSHVMLPDY